MLFRHFYLLMGFLPLNRIGEKERRALSDLGEDESPPDIKRSSNEIWKSEDDLRLDAVLHVIYI
jgi:hypothetical protein